MRLSRRRIQAIVAVVAVLLAGYAAVSYYFAGLIVAFSTHTLEEQRAARGIDDPAHLGMGTPEEVAITAGDVTIAGWLFHHPAPRRCAAVLLHGHGNTRYGVLEYAPLVWKRGCHVLAMDARHHGASTGAYGTYGYHEKHDLAAVVTWLGERLSLPASRIGLVGESMGAAIALQAAAIVPDIAFVIADSSFSELAAMVERRGVALYGSPVRAFLPGAMTIAGWRAGADIYDAAPVRYAARVQAPVLLIHSRADDGTPWQHSQAIHDAIPHARKAVHILDWGTPHTEAVNQRYADYERLVDDFFARHLPDF